MPAIYGSLGTISIDDGEAKDDAFQNRDLYFTFQFCNYIQSVQCTDRSQKLLKLNM